MSRSAKARRKARKARKRQRAMENGQVFAQPKRRDPNVLGMVLGRCGRAWVQTNGRAKASATACRGKVDDD